MKAFLMFARVLLSIVVITIGCNYVSKPSDVYLVLGIAGILAGIVLIYHPIKTLIQQFQS